MSTTILLPDGIGYKANLHGHTTDSDGNLTPEQAKQHYKEHGYSILAYTDHLYMRDRTSLNDEHFVALNGYENGILDWDMTAWDNNGNRNPIESKCYHLNFYSPTPDKIGMVGIEKYFHDYFNRLKTQQDKDLCPVLNGYIPSGKYSRQLAQQCIDEALKLGYLVAYNHADWSLQGEDDFLGLKGLCAMEIVNGGSVRGGYSENLEFVYDRMLRDGQQICCLANDDNHNSDPNDDDSFIGYNVMYPDTLTYGDVFNCLKDGRLYASTGAVIRGVTIVDNKVIIGAENADSIRFVTNGRKASRIVAKEKPLTSVQFDIDDEYLTYFRVVVKSKEGTAYTKAFFRTEDKKGWK